MKRRGLSTSSSAALCQAKNKTFLLDKMVRILKKRPFHRLNRARRKSITCMYGIWYIHVPSALHVCNLYFLVV